MPALVGYWLPKRLVLGTGVYTNGLLVGEIFPVALPLLLPTFADVWRATFALWAAPIVAIAVNKRPAVTAAMTPMRATRREPANDATANMTMGIPLSAPISVPVRANSARSAGIAGGTARIARRSATPISQRRASESGRVRGEVTEFSRKTHGHMCKPEFPDDRRFAMNIRVFRPYYRTDASCKRLPTDKSNLSTRAGQPMEHSKPAPFCGA